MMDAHRQAAIVSRLAEALRQAGIVISRAVLTGGSVGRWDEVAPEAVVGVMLARGWRVDLVSDRPPADPAQLQLVPDVTPEEHGHD